MQWVKNAKKCIEIFQQSNPRIASTADVLAVCGSPSKLKLIINLFTLARRTIYIKGHVIIFKLNNLTIWCKHVHWLELHKFFNFCAAHLPVRLDIETKFPYFLFLTWLSIIRDQEFSLYI